MEEINGWKLKENSKKTYIKNGITAVIFQDKICFGRNGAMICEYEIKIYILGGLKNVAIKKHREGL